MKRKIMLVEDTEERTLDALRLVAKSQGDLATIGIRLSLYLDSKRCGVKMSASDAYFTLNLLRSAIGKLENVCEYFGSEMMRLVNEERSNHE